MAATVDTLAMETTDAEPCRATIEYLPETFRERIWRRLFGKKSSIEFVLVAKNAEHMSTILEIAGREARKPKKRLKKIQHPGRRSWMLTSI